jgi:hypothetical protein
MKKLLAAAVVVLCVGDGCRVRAMEASSVSAGPSL